MVHAIINPISGAGTDRHAASRRVAMIDAAASRRGIAAQIHLTSHAGHAGELARTAVAAGAAALIVWGGDGTINEAGAALIGSDTVLGVVPAGSGNGLAAALGVVRDPAAALTDAFDAAPHRIDAGLMNGRPFFNIAGIGFDARVATLFNQRSVGSRGAWPYVVIGMTEGCRYCAVEYTVTMDAEETRSRALLIAFANGREYGIGARIAPGARLDDGVLDAVVVEDTGSIMTRFWHARHLATGSAHLAPMVTVRQIRHAVIETDGQMEYHVDGEPGLAEGRIEVSIIPGALSVRTRRLSL
ncbi:MAG TPA: YegS/Rv2252/BmrU family lipid kinase [Vicinamibacterales bacterium]|nr:YegS/Rv2252/BmrU family lipid kinase [Vicinamibacterales bacterium]